MCTFGFGNHPRTEPPKSLAGAQFVCSIPSVAGRVISIANYGSVNILRCEYGVYLINKHGKISKIEPMAPPRLLDPSLRAP